MKRLVVLLVFVLIAGAGVFAYFKYFTVPPTPQIYQSTVTEGDITEAAIATGTLSALRTVDVGTEVSGIVKTLHVDFNSIVHKGEVIAELDPSEVQQELDSAVAAKDRAQIDIDQQLATLAIDQKNLDRAEALHLQSLDTDQDREQAQLTVKEDQAVLKQDKAAVAIADANIEQSKVDLQHCTIVSPIDGVVISRNVDEGQTVAARMATPTLYVLASDLTQLQIVADVDESDVSRIHAGQNVSFTVDAYAGRKFSGKVQIVRLNATNTNNVVTYQVVATVANPDLRLMPGMTATIGIEIWTAEGAIRVPASALHFRPSDDIFNALGQIVPPEAHAKAAPPPPPANIGVAPTPITMTSGNTIDHFFKPFPRPETSGTVWVMRNGQLEPVALRLGVTDGTWTELVGTALQPGNQVVTNVLLPPGLKHVTPTSNPLMPPQRGTSTPRTPGR